MLNMKFKWNSVQNKRQFIISINGPKSKGDNRMIATFYFKSGCVFSFLSSDRTFFRFVITMKSQCKVHFFLSCFNRASGHIHCQNDTVDLTFFGMTTEIYIIFFDEKGKKLHLGSCSTINSLFLCLFLSRVQFGSVVLADSFQFNCDPNWKSKRDK